jgi:hypothetical protein
MLYALAPLPLALSLVVAQAPAAPAPEAPPAAAPAPAEAAPPPAAPAPAVLPAPTKPRLLVMDLVDKGAGAEVANAVNQAIQGQAVQSHLGETVTSTQIKIALDAAANQAMVGCESEACMTDIGKTVEASIILGGSIAKVGDDFLITLLTVNPRDGSRLQQAQRKVPSNRELYYYAARQLTSLVLTGRAVDPRVPVVIKVAEGDGDATFIVDGKEIATGATTTVQLDPGSHEVRVRKSGKAEWKTLLSVEEATPQQVTANLVDDRIELWPVAIATGGATVVAGALALGFGLAAQDTFDGTIDLPLYDRVPASSYSKKEPINSQELFSLQQEVERNALAANILYVSAGVLAVATAGLITTDLVLGASAE